MRLLNKELLKSNIERIAEYDPLHHKAFGSAYCVIQEDEIIYKNCFGYTSLDAASPVTENTIFRLASMTKPVTAMAVMILAERGVLSLSDPVWKYLPAFRDVHVIECTDSQTFTDKGKAKTDITIRHLLTHTAGFGSEEPKILGMTAKDKRTIDDSIQYFLKEGLDYEPGTNQKYSATGAFDVLVKIMELVTGMDFQEFVKKEIFVPCKMLNTAFVPTKEQWAAMMDMPQIADGKISVKRTGDCIFGDYPCTHYLGGAGLVSTLSDYTNFAKMLLNEGKTETGGLISEESFRLLTTPYVPKEIMPGIQNWGLGLRLMLDESSTDLQVDTFGMSGAFGSHFWVDPRNRIVAVLLKNSPFDPVTVSDAAKNFEKAVADSFLR